MFFVRFILKIPAPQKPDRRIRGKLEECYFRWFGDWGFNFARLPMDYRDFLATNDWTRLKREGFAKVDLAVAWGRKYGVYVQLKGRIYEQLVTTLAKFAASRKAGYPVMIGELGCYNRLRHETCLAWMEECLKLWRKEGLG